MYETIFPEYLTEPAQNIRRKRTRNKSLLLKTLLEYKNGKYTELYSCLNPQIRNSIQHQDFFIDPKKPEITFYDRNKPPLTLSARACSIAGIEKGYINVLMGHRTDISDSYLEKPRATLELRYAMAEPYLTIFSGDTSQEIAEMKEQVLEYSACAHEYSERQDQAFDLMFRLEKENTELKTDVKALREAVDGLTKYIEMLEEIYEEREPLSGPDEELK